MEANFNISNLDLKKKTTIFLGGWGEVVKEETFSQNSELATLDPCHSSASNELLTVNKSLKLQIAHLYNKILKGR